MILKHLDLKMDPLCHIMIPVKGTLFLYRSFRWLTGLDFYLQDMYV